MRAVDLLAEFREQGFVRVRGFLSGAEVAELRAAIEAAPVEDPAENPLSLDGMRFASNVYRCSEALQRFLSSEPVIGLVGAVGGPDLWVRWDQAVWKEHGAPEFPWHQDNGYTGLDATHLQLWVALTPMTEANGGLLVCPGGHLRLLEHRTVGGHVAADPPGPIVTIDAEPGDVILFSSYLPHATTPNTTGDARLSYVAEFLPLGCQDRSVEPPHLVVARGGRSALGWDDLTPGWATTSIPRAT